MNGDIENSKLTESTSTLESGKHPHEHEEWCIYYRWDVIHRASRATKTCLRNYLIKIEGKQKNGMNLDEIDEYIRNPLIESYFKIAEETYNSFGPKFLKLCVCRARPSSSSSVQAPNVAEPIRLNHKGDDQVASQMASVLDIIKQTGLELSSEGEEMEEGTDNEKQPATEEALNDSPSAGFVEIFKQTGLELSLEGEEMDEENEKQPAAGEAPSGSPLIVTCEIGTSDNEDSPQDVAVETGTSEDPESPMDLDVEICTSENANSPIVDVENVDSSEEIKAIDDLEDASVTVRDCVQRLIEVVSSNQKCIATLIELADDEENEAIDDFRNEIDVDN